MSKGKSIHITPGHGSRDDPEARAVQERVDKLRQEIAAINVKLYGRLKPLGYQRKKMLSRRYTCVFELSKLGKAPQVK